MSLLDGLQVTNYNGATQVLGSGSGFDTNSLIQLDMQMMQAQDKPLNDKKNVLTQEQSLWNQLKSFLSDIQTSSDKLKSINAGNKDITSTDSSVANITANSSAIDGSYTLNVQQIATYQKIMSDNQGSATTPLGYNGTVQINGKDFTFTPTMTLSDVVSNINGGDYGVNATLISGYLVLSSQKTGESNTIQFVDSAGTNPSASSSDTSVADVQVTGTPTSGNNTYNLVVNQLATNQILSSDSVTDITAPLGYTGTMIINGQTINVVDTDTLQDIASKINNIPSLNVTASIDANNKLVLTGTQTGSTQNFTVTDSTSNVNTTDTLLQSIGLLDASNNFKNVVSTAQDAQYTINGISGTSSDNIARDIQGVEVTLKSVSSNPTTITVNGATSGILTSLGILNSSGTIKNEVQKAQDAKYDIDGISMTSDTNSLQNAITGVTVELVKPTTTPMTFTINQDKQSISDAVQTFVNSYNKAIMQLGAITAKGAALQGQQIPTRAKMDLDNALTLKGGSSSMLAYQLGIEIDGVAKDGTVTFDTTKLTKAMDNNVAGVTSMLTDPNGFVAKVYNIINDITKAEGSIDTKTGALQKNIDDINNTLQKNQERYTQEQNTIMEKYSNFETLMSQLNSQNDYITAQIQAMNNSGKNNG